MTVKIIPNDKGNPPGKLADAELHFDAADGVSRAEVDRICGLGASNGRGRNVRSRRGNTRSTVSVGPSPCCDPCRPRRAGPDSRSDSGRMRRQKSPRRCADGLRRAAITRT